MENGSRLHRLKPVCDAERDIKSRTVLEQQFINKFKGMVLLH